MSIEAVEEFFEKAEDDASLREAIRSMLEGKEAFGCCAFAALAAEHGFQFTPEEMHDGIERLRKLDEERELTDEDLEHVAGGTRQHFMLPHFVPGMSTRMVSVLYGVPGRRGPGANALYMVPVYGIPDRRF
jgi:predicted ribosomally synthesized peptide with nif11-like leader